ncbi:MAG: hypothetical protein ACLQIQ_01135 [Beijerinckiaceae bacterium]
MERLRRHRRIVAAFGVLVALLGIDLLLLAAGAITLGLRLRQSF